MVARRLVAGIVIFCYLILGLAAIATETNLVLPTKTPSWLRQLYSKANLTYLGIWDGVEIVQLTIKLYRLPIEQGQEVLLFNADNPQWHGKAEEIEQILLKLISLAREKEMMKENILPIRVATLHFRSPTLGIALVQSIIILNPSILKHFSAELAAETVIHEFSHLISKRSGHGEDWQRICQALAAAFFAKRPASMHYCEN